MVAVIPLTRGYVALVDDEDAESVRRYKWRSLIARRRHGPPVVYAVRSVALPRINGKPRSRTVYLHRFLVPSAKGVDHKDGDGLNNRRFNLRSANQTQNNANRRIGGGRKTSRFKGVMWDANRGRWRATIVSERKSRFLGYFDNEEEAARAYDASAFDYFGEFARPNFDGSRL